MDALDEPVDDRIAGLEWAIAAGDPTADRPTLMGMLGLAMLERYRDRPSDVDLDGAIRWLESAIDAEPTHPDVVGWSFWLGCAYAERGRSGSDPTDFDRAINWTERTLAGVAPDDPERDLATVLLLDCEWDRSWQRRYPPVAGEGAAAADAHRVVERLDTIRVGGADPVAGAYATAMAGAARVERFWYRTDDDGMRADIDAGLDALDRGFSTLLRLRDDDPDAVSDWASDGRMSMLGELLAEGYQQRWYFLNGADPADLDNSIAAWERQLDTEWSRWAARNCGDLLTERAGGKERPTGPADGRRAVELLRQMAADSSIEADWQEWDALGAAEHTCWQHTGEEALLVSSGEHRDRALALGITDDDRLLVCFAGRMTTENELAREDTSTFRRLIETGHLTLDRASAADGGTRAMFALLLVTAEMAAAGRDQGPVDLVRMRERLTFARKVNSTDSEYHALVDGVFGALEQVEYIYNPDSGTDGGLRNLSRAVAADVPGLAEEFDLLARTSLFTRVGTTGNLRHARRWAGEAKPADDHVPDDAELVDALGTLTSLGLVGDLAGVARIAREMRAALGDQADDPTTLGPMLGWFAAFGDHESRPLVEVPTTDRPAGLAGDLHLFKVITSTMMLLLQASTRRDSVALRSVVGHAERVLAQLRPGENRMALAAHNCAARAWLELSRHDAGAAERAVEHYRHACTLAGGHTHPMWHVLATDHAHALRRCREPDLRGSRELGRSALRALAWQVFVQSGTEHALSWARLAGEQSRTVAQWCLSDRNHEPGVDDDLVAVLDAGRALTLRAASGSRVIPDLLTEHGRPDLAEEWRATAGSGRDLLTGQVAAPLAGGEPAALQISDELRLKALETLRDADISGFEPVTTDEIRTGLRAVGADALVYLLAGADGQAGVAVIVPGSGPPLVCPLPGLVVGSDSPVSRYARHRSDTRDMTPVSPRPPSPGHADLEAVTTWAWTAAMEDLLRPAPRHLVLVPLGILGLVPWHAAVRWHDGRRRYAVEDAVISYAPSARTLCTVADGPVRPVRSSLVVGDPGGDLRFAAVEARAVHHRFYAAGSYFGHPAGSADRPGSPDDVLNWIDTSPDGPSMLHFACHGRIDPANPADAHLVLAGAARLSVRALLDRARSAAVDIDQVFLAACSTGFGGDDHDEVLSLATSFMAAGARTVFGTLWAVPDGDTSVLMYLVHHYLRADGVPPAQALNRAQRWMLDPDRRPPDGMPAELWAACRPGKVFSAESWGGVVHVGR